MGVPLLLTPVTDSTFIVAVKISLLVPAKSECNNVMVINFGNEIHFNILVLAVVGCIK